MVSLPKTTPLIVMLGSLTALFVIACAGSKNDTRSANDNASGQNSQVVVSGTVSDESASDFKQSGESVQVGGTNLADDVADSIEIWSVAGDGTRQKYKTVSVSNKNFTVVLPGNSYYQLVGTKSRLEGVMSPWMLSGTKSTQANVMLTRSTTVASKILGIIANRIKSGDSDAATVLSNKLIAPSDLVTIGASVALATSESNQFIADLGILASDAVTHTAAKAKQSGLDYSAFATAVSVYQQLGLFNIAYKDIKPDVSAARTSSVNNSYDVPRKVTASYSDKSSNVALEAACVALETNYRAASSVSEASSQTTTSKVQSDYNGNANQPASELHNTSVAQPPVVQTPVPTPNPSSSNSGTSSPTYTPTATTSSTATSTSSPTAMATASSSGSGSPSPTP